MHQEEEQHQQPEKTIIKRRSRFSNTATVFANIMVLPEDLVPVIYSFIPTSVTIFSSKTVYLKNHKLV